MRDLIQRLEERHSGPVPEDLRDTDRLVRAVDDALKALDQYLAYGHGYRGAEGRVFDEVTKVVGQMAKLNDRLQASTDGLLKMVADREQGRG